MIKKHNYSISIDDLTHIMKHTESFFSALKNARIFITGGTGFIGKWLLETFIFANEQLSLNIQMTVLTRDAEKFSLQMPYLAKYPNISFHLGDIRNFTFPEDHFTHVIHGAADPSPHQAYLETYDVTVHGTQRVLDFCRTKQIAALLLLSSGAVYGMQSSELLHVTENCLLAPAVNLPRTAYGHGKRLSEWLCATYEQQYNIQSKIARCFALSGPHLPLDTHFALGNFVKDAMANKPIIIKGDGTPTRSYLYAADMVIWLLTIFIQGKSNYAYNLGSEEAITLKDLAWRVAKLSGSTQGVTILSPIDETRLSEYYVPSTQRAKKELALDARINLDNSLLRMISWKQA